MVYNVIVGKYVGLKPVTAYDLNALGVLKGMDPVLFSEMFRQYEEKYAGIREKDEETGMVRYRGPDGKFISKNKASRGLIVLGLISQAFWESPHNNALKQKKIVIDRNFVESNADKIVVPKDFESLLGLGLERVVAYNSVVARDFFPEGASEEFKKAADRTSIFNTRKYSPDKGTFADLGRLLDTFYRDGTLENDFAMVAIQGYISKVHEGSFWRKDLLVLGDNVEPLVETYRNVREFIKSERDDVREKLRREYGGLINVLGLTEDHLNYMRQTNELYRKADGLEIRFD